jgi:hypothetical protein
MKYAGANLVASRLTRWLPWLFVLLPVLQGFRYVHLYGVNVVWLDQWVGMAPLFEKWHAGTLAFSDFWAQLNEQRCIVPRGLMFVLGLLTRWNTLAEMYVVQFSLAAILSIFLFAFLRECQAKNRVWRMVPIAFLVFSLRQSENMLFGFQILFAFAALGTIAALWCLCLLDNPKHAVLKYSGALLCATAATFSSGQGLLVWPVGLPALFAARLTGRRRAILAAIWTIAGLVQWWVYFSGFTKPSKHPELAFSIQYFLAIVGGSLFQSLGLAMMAGAIILSLVLASVFLAFRVGDFRRQTFWLSVLAYGLLVQAQTTVARSGFGPGQALSSRYATFSLLIVIGAYAILSSLNDEKRARLISGLWGISLILVMMGVMHSTPKGYQEGTDSRQQRENWAFMLTTSDSQPDEILAIDDDIPSPLVRRVTSFMKEHQWNLFASSDLADRYAVPDPDFPEIPSRAHTNVTYRGPHEDFPGVLVVSGWALDAAEKDVVGAVFLDIDGVLYPTFYGVSQHDSMRVWEDDPRRYSGFLRAFPRSLFSKGRHRLIVRAMTKDRTAWFSPSVAVEFDIREP